MEDTEYTLITTIKEVYIIKRVYYKPTGILKSESESFNNIEVNTAKYYDEQGHLTEEYKYTSSDWVDRLTKVVKEKLNIDLWSTRLAVLSTGTYQGKEVVTVIHNKGQYLDIRNDMADKYIILLDANTLEIIKQYD